MQQRIAYVYSSGILAGTLTHKNGQTSFTYTPGYISSQGEPLGASLPLTDQPYTAGAGALPAFFSNLLPEGRRLTALRQSIKTSLDNELSLLLAVGSDTVGAVQIFDHLVEEPPRSSASQSNESIDFNSVTFSHFFAAQGLIDYVSLPGVQEKVSGRMLTVSLPHLGDGHLLKLNPPEFPYVIENEQLFLRHAAALKLRCGVNETRVVHDANNASGLLVKRFDRADSNGLLTKIPTQDGCQLLGIYPADKYAVSTENLVEAVLDSVSTPALAALDLYKQILFAWLTGNGDLHAKNISIYKPGAEWKLTPVYDIPSTAPYGDKSMALSLGGRKTGLSRQQFLKFASSISIPEQLALRAINDVIKLAPKIATDAQKLPLDSHRAKELQKLLRARAHSLRE